MSKCETCELRKAIARTFDLHWMGEDDCPMQFPYNTEEDQDEY